jgi:hypothetical protein
MGGEQALTEGCTDLYGGTISVRVKRVKAMHETYQTVVSNPAEIRSEHLRNNSLDHYSYTNLLCDMNTMKDCSSSFYMGLKLRLSLSEIQEKLYDWRRGTGGTLQRQWNSETDTTTDVHNNIT